MAPISYPYDPKTNSRRLTVRSMQFCLECKHSILPGDNAAVLGKGGKDGYLCASCHAWRDVTRRADAGDLDALAALEGRIIQRRRR